MVGLLAVIVFRIIKTLIWQSLFRTTWPKQYYYCHNKCAKLVYSRIYPFKGRCGWLVIQTQHLYLSAMGHILTQSWMTCDLYVNSMKCNKVETVLKCNVSYKKFDCFSFWSDNQTDGQKVEIFLDDSFKLNKLIGDIFTYQGRLSSIEFVFPFWI